CDQRLLNEHAQHRARKEDFHGFGVDQNLAGSRLNPDARHRVLALAGGVGTVLSVDFLFVFRRFRRSRLEGRQSFQRLYGLGHDQALLTFLRFIAATSSFSGFCASCGWSGPGYTRRFPNWTRPRGPRGNMRSTAFSTTRSGKRPSMIAFAVRSLMPPINPVW